MLLAPLVATPDGTLVAIGVLRDALDYLESRYAKQLGRSRQTRETTTAPAKKPAAGAAKRGRRKRANGEAAETPPAGLPFGAADAEQAAP